MGYVVVGREGKPPVAFTTIDGILAYNEDPKAATVFKARVAAVNAIWRTHKFFIPIGGRKSHWPYSANRIVKVKDK